MGIPPTGNQVRIDLTDIVRIADGQVVEHWNVVDQLGLMRQLSLVEAVCIDRPGCHGRACPPVSVSMT